MKERFFRFKQFDVDHSRSPMKVGVDGVMLGAWVGVDSIRRILDVGCGCGLISLMLAQRNPEVEVLGIDIYGPAVEEAEENFMRSPWNDRLKAIKTDFCEFAVEGENIGRFDLIVSNPPFFDDGVNPTLSPRLGSRHTGGLSPVSLLTMGEHLLTPGGRIAMIVPPERFSDLKEAAAYKSLSICRCCKLISVEGKDPKRLLLEFKKESNASPVIESLTINHTDGTYTSRYKIITSPFYLKF